MRVFVTGGSGYIGQATIRALVRHGHVVTALARDDNAAVALAGLSSAVVRGELTSLDVLRAAASDADGVIHLAPSAPEIDLAAAEAMQDGATARPYVHTGGVWVYGDTGGLVDEAAPLAPPPPVAWRPANEQRILARASTGGHPILIMPAVVYGDHRGLIEDFFVRPAREAGEARYIGDGSTHWALVHVEDIAELYVLALNAPAGAKYAGVGDARPTARDLAVAVSHAAGCPDRIRSITIDEARAEMGVLADAFALDQQVSNARARDGLGWRPTHDDPLGELAKG